MKASDGVRWTADPSSWVPATEARTLELEEEWENQEAIFKYFMRGRDLRAQAFRDVVGRSVAAGGAAAGVHCVCSNVALADAYQWVAVLEFDSADRASTPIVSLRPAPDKAEESVSLFDAAINAALLWFCDELSRRGDGRHYSTRRDVDTILRQAGSFVMGAVERAVSKDLILGDTFMNLDSLSVLKHERAEGRGRLLYVRTEDVARLDPLRFQKEVPLSEIAWVRKLLEMARDPLSLLVSGDKIVGLVDASPLGVERNHFTVQFEGQHRWLLEMGNVPLMRVSSGLPRLPARPVQSNEFARVFARIFPLQAEHAQTVWSVVEAVLSGDHGSIVLITHDAAAEAERLSSQGTPVVPKVLSPVEARSAARVDGALMLDPTGICHAVGVVLDGEAVSAGLPSRGARFNSALRYVLGDAASQCLAVVRSEDGWVDILPRLRPQIRRSQLDAYLEEIRATAGDAKTPELRKMARVIGDYVDALDLSEKDVERLMSLSFEPRSILDDERRPPPEFDRHATDFLPEDGAATVTQSLEREPESA